MQQSTKRKRSYLGLIVIVSTLAVLMLILIAAVAALFLTNRSNADNPLDGSLLTAASPLDIVEVEKVDPALALASLGGVPQADVITAAINKARPETALAATLYDPSLSDKESAGDFLLLAAAYQKTGNAASLDRQKAVSCYRLAGTIATLSPDIPDTARADIFIQVGEGFIAVNEIELARFYLDQAFVVAAKSPYLQAAHRRTIFETLQKNYIRLNDREAARKSLNFTANLPSPTSTVVEQAILPSAESIPLPAAVQEAEANRWRRAQELAAILVERGGKAPKPTVEALREALLEEDGLKLPFYETELAAAARISKKIDITRAKIKWLSIKYRMARQAYGMSIVPEWETQAEQIRASLTKTYESLYALYADLIVALPDVSQIDRATEERLRREVLAGELGRYPNYPEEQRQKQLLDATGQLLDSQPELNLFVGVGTINGRELFTLTSRE